MQVHIKTRRVLFLAGLLFLPTLAGIANAGELTSDLATQLGQADPTEFIEAIVVLREKPDVRSEIAALGPGARDRALTHRRIVQHLKEVSSRTQVNLRAEIEAWAAAGSLREYHAYWIVNAIYVIARPEVIQALAANPDVELVDANHIIKLPEPQPVSTNPPPPGNRGIEWGVQKINADDLWEMGYKGDGILVCNIDSGVDGTHPALDHNWRGNWTLDSEAWYDPWGVNNLPTDDDDHGTHVMGTICGEDGDDKIGVAPEAEWIAANYFEGDNGPWATALLCFEWAADPDGNPLTVDDVPHVVNCSWGSGTPSQCGVICDDAIVNLEGCGTVVVFSAGNDGPGTGTVTRPASSCLDSTTVFSVGATNSSDDITDFSSRGPSPCACSGTLDIKPEVSAPGRDIRSAEPGGGYQQMSGTSMAAPHVSGAIALLRQAYPEAHPIELKKALMRSAVDRGDVGEDNSYGWGRIDAYEALFELYTEDSLDTLYVDQSNTTDPWDGSADNPFPTISEAALKASRVGARVISVAPGTYVENVWLPRRLTLLGAGAESTIIEGTGAGDIVSMYKGGSISGFTVRNTSGIGIVIALQDGFPSEVKNCIVTGVVYGIWVTMIDETGDCDITRCVIHSGVGMGAGLAIGGGNFEVINNTIDGYYCGVWTSSAVADIYNNLVTNCILGTQCDTSTLTKAHNGYWNNSSQDIGPNCGGEGFEDLFYDPFYMNRANGDFRLMAGSPYIDEGAWGRDIRALEFIPSSLVTSPTGLGTELAGEDGQIRFYWNPVSAASGYQVYYAASPGWPYNGDEAVEGSSPIEMTGGANDTSLVLTGLTNGVQYHLDVSSYDSADLESDLTALAYTTVTPADEEPPGYPSGMTATAGDTTITLSWTNPTDVDWAGTMIRRNTSTYPAEHWQGTLVYSGTGTGCVDKNLTNGTTYYYAAFAYDEVPNYSDNACGTGCRATAIPADTTPPGPPVFTSTEAGDGQVELTWSNPGAPDWTLTRILRRTDRHPNDHLDGTQVYQGTGTSVTDTGLSNGSTYYYGAFARDELEAGNWSAAAPAAQTDAIPRDVTPPTWSDGDGLDFVETNVGEATLYWNIATDASSPPVFYNVYYDTISPAWQGTKLTHVAASPDPGSFDLTFTVSGLKNGRLYRFLVRAEDSNDAPNETADTAEWSNWVEYRSPGDTPGAGSRFTLSGLVSASDGGIEDGTAPGEFYLFGSVTIAAYDTLQIDSGETLVSLDTSGQKKLIVLGTLEAEGSSSKGYVTLTGAGAGAGNRWGGLQLGEAGIHSPGATSLLDHVIVEKCVDGVRWFGGNPRVTNSTLRYITSTALFAECGADTVEIIENVVHGCGGNAIDCQAKDGGYVWIDENQVYNNNGNGIWLALKTDNQASISNNEVHHNASGIHFGFETGFTMLDSLVVDDNSVYSNTGYGIHVGQTGAQTIISNNTSSNNSIGIDFFNESLTGAKPLVENNTVTGNSYAGIRCGLLATPLIDGCLVANNGDYGILSVDSARPVVTNSTLSGNGVGVCCLVDTWAGQVDLGNLQDGDTLNDGGNQLYNNVTFEVQNLTPNLVKAQNNFWGNATEQAMMMADQACPPQGCVQNHNCGQTCNMAVIWDVHDLMTLGQVDFAWHWPGAGGNPPSIDLLSPAMDEGADTSYEITWDDDDPEDDATISLYFYRDDPDSLEAIPGASNLSEDDPIDSFVWGTTAIDTGTYHIRAVITDGWESAESEAPGLLVIGHPFVDVDTTAITAVLRPDSTRTLPLTVHNVGSYDLSVQFSDLGSDGFDLPWLEFDPVSDTISPGDSLVAEVIFDASNLGVGHYAGRILLSASDPWNPEISIGLELEVTYSSLVLSESSLDFGSVSLSDTVGLFLEVMNAGNDTLNIWSMTSALPDYWFETPEYVLPSFRDTILVFMSPGTAGDRPDTLLISSDDPDSNLFRVPLSGRGMNRLRLSSTAVDFGDVPLFGSGTDSIWVVNGDTTSFSLTGASGLDSPFFVWDTAFPHFLAVEDSVQIRVRFTPVQLGSYTDTLTVTTDHSRGLAGQVFLTGDSTNPTISLSTASLAFGIVALGDSATADLWAHNTGSGDLLISSATTSDPLFTVISPAFPQSVAEGDSVQTTLCFSPDQPGSESGTLTLFSNDPIHSSVQVQLTASGPVADIHVPSPIVDFGEALAALDTVPGSVAITNLGTEDLQVSGLSFENVAFSLLTTAPFTVTPGDTQAVSLLFHPGEEGLVEDFLSVTSNDPNPAEATVLIDLTGVGVMPVLTILADSLVADSWEDGTAAASCPVVNTGSGTLNFEVTEADSEPADLPWLDVFPDAGSVSAGDTLSLAVSFDPSPVGHGVYSGRLLFSSNVPGGAGEVPVILRVPRMHYADVDTGNIRLTVTDEGAFGFFDKDQMADYGGGIYGSGCKFPVDDLENHLFQGSIWLGRDTTYVADASYDYDWEATPDGALLLTHEEGNQVGRASMTDAHGPTPLGVQVHLTVLAAPDSPDDDYVLIDLRLENTTDSLIEGLYAGLFMDWDTGDPFQNVGGYDANDGLGYLTDLAHPDSTHVGLVALIPFVPNAFRLIHNPTYIHPYDEVRDEDAFAFLSSATIDDATYETSDWSMVMAGGPFNIAPGDSAALVLAVVAGQGLADIKANAARARLVHGPTAVAQDQPGLIKRYKLGTLYPNPFNPSISFKLEVPDPGGPVSIRVYDIRGRCVDRILEREVKPGCYTFTWRGADETGRSLASGVYFFRLTASDVVQVRRALLLK